LTVCDAPIASSAVSVQLRVKMVWPLIVGVSEPESAEETVMVPAVENWLKVQALMWEVLQLTVVVWPFCTRIGEAVNVVMLPGTTQVEPLCISPEGHKQFGE